ncbi:hypothetical protein KAR91_78735 [Candidatus Pacearchaeota archaeon]|nr:hypothetical protein [Candidatus Pacearchaeota archaeon]
MASKQTEAELNKIVSDINLVLVGKQCEITGQHEFKPLLIGFKPCISQMAVFGCDVILKSEVYVDKQEKHQKTIVVERTISACDHMIDTLKTHISKLEAMLT